MNNITNRLETTRMNKSLPIKPTSRIKIVKKQRAAASAATNAATVVNTNTAESQEAQQTTNVQTSNDLRIRSISPGVLRRAPDIIETIETKTSMSFIMNKSVNLLVEEKREPPATTVFAPRNTGLSSAISQPQLYQSRIDDLLNTANNLIKSSTQSGTTSGVHNKTVYKSKFKINSGAFKTVLGSNDNNGNSTPIPITVQSRSKSEPKLDQEAMYRSLSPKSNFNVIKIFFNYHVFNLLDFFMKLEYNY